jgi:hypothetical protein
MPAETGRTQGDTHADLVEEFVKLHKKKNEAPLTEPEEQRWGELRRMLIVAQRPRPRLG